MQPCCTPFPIWNQSFVPCPVLTAASWPAYRSLRRQVRWSGIPVFWIFQSVVIHTVKGLAIVNKAEVDFFFFWNSLAFSMIQRMLGIWPLVPLYFLNPAWTSGSSRLLKPGLENFEHYFASMWNILQHCLSLGLEWKLTFSSPVATAEFSKFAGILSAALSQHHFLGFERAQLEFHSLY